MKLATSSTLSMLGVVALVALGASTVRAATPPGVAPVVALQDQAAACPAAAPANPAPTWKNGEAEYTDYNTALQTKDPKQQAQLLAAFVQKYPNSDYKNPAIERETEADYTAGDQPAAFHTAESLMQSPGANASELLNADVIISAIGPGFVQPGDSADLATLNTAATCGQQLAGKLAAAQSAKIIGIMQKAQAFVLFSQKNYPEAIGKLQALTQTMPTDAQVYYWLGSAEVASGMALPVGDQQNADYTAGIYYLARATDVAPPAGAGTIRTYLNQVYTSYHGSADGLQDVLTAAQNSPTMPSDFKVVDQNTIAQQQANSAYQQQLQQQQEQLKQSNSFEGMEARLQDSNLQAKQEADLKASKAAIGVTGIVTSATHSEVELKVDAANAAAATAPDLKVIMDKPLAPADTPKPGDKVDVAGMYVSYTTTPGFLMTLDKGTCTIDRQ